MNAISALSSFNSRAVQGTSLPSAQQAQRGNVNTSNGVGAARGNANAGASSAYCPTCVGGSGARGGAASSSSYCPTCNQAGGRQANVTSFGTNNANAARTGAAQTGAAHSHQGGRICVGCAYQGR
ncbi:MAG: hypothetical protein FWE95_06570 [Planctomycetaceae bacterium]|nr:hypothetical protein [Planctomycetaceae bacterium]